MVKIIYNMTDNPNHGWMQKLLIFIYLKMFADSTHVYQKSSGKELRWVLFVSE